MKKVIIENNYWNIFPESRIAVVLAKDIDNNKDIDLKSLIMSSKEKALSFIGDCEFSENNFIKVWREAFKKFKTKKGARSSIESLMKRIKNDNEIPSINNLVDIYNSTSLSFALPCGGEDIDKISGNILLTTANGDENFFAYGSDKEEKPFLGEIVYKDDIGIICRCLNWREGIRTILTKETRNAILFIECIDDLQFVDLEKALIFLTENIKKYLGGNVSYKILDIKDPEMKI